MRTAPAAQRSTWFDGCSGVLLHSRSNHVRGRCVGSTDDGVEAHSWPVGGYGAGSGVLWVVEGEVARWAWEVGDALFA